MSYTVKAVNDNEGAVIKRNVRNVEQAREVGREAYRNQTIEQSDIVQIWSDDDDVTAVEEFGSDEI